jgi:hypothetical protein
VDLFEMISTHFKDIVNFPIQSTHGLSDEQFVSNIVQLLFISDKAILSQNKQDLPTR